MAVFPPVDRPALSFCAFCSCVGLLVEDGCAVTEAASVVEESAAEAATVEVMTTTVGCWPAPVGVEVTSRVETSVVGGGADAVTTLVVSGRAEGEAAGGEEAAGAGSDDEPAGNGALETGAGATDEAAGAADVAGGGLEAAGGVAEAALDEGAGAAAAVDGGDDGNDGGSGGDDAAGEGAPAGNVLAVALLDMAAIGRQPRPAAERADRRRRVGRRRPPRGAAQARGGTAGAKGVAGMRQTGMRRVESS